MINILCSRGTCDGCPIADKCELIELTEEVNPYALYEQGTQDERPKAFSSGYEGGYEQGRADATRWIPCSERLPEESLNSVIGWDAYRERCVFVQYCNGCFQNMGTYESFDIKAWMPLPEPYRKEQK